MSQRLQGAPGRRSKWSRRYPPLILLALALLAAVIILPSALNLPQSNPSTVLEYAPVPPQDQHPPPLQGNESSLGLGTSHTLAAAAPPPKPPPPPPGLSGAGATPKQFQCVGNPPRQTDDPSSPPCVPFFQGDNFGATYQGVTSGEITVLIYIDQGGYGNEGPPPVDTYIDIDKPPLPQCPPTWPEVSDPTQCDFPPVREARAFSRYFNSRFQTYGRHVHFWLYVGNSTTTAAQRRSDAVANWQKLHPFAVLDEAVFGGFNEEYDDAMNQLSVMSFGSVRGSVPNSLYRKNAPLSWGFYPDVEHWAALYSAYICKKVAPYPVAHYGNPSGVGPPNGTKRKFGLWYTSDPAAQGPQLFAQLVKQEIRSCGIDGVPEHTYSHDGYAVNGQDTGTEGAQAAADFQSKGVTTILYLGGTETRLSASSDAISYYPEIVFAGNLLTDNASNARNQNQNVWKNAWGMTFHVRQNRLEDSPGYRAYKDGDPSGDDVAGGFAVDDYRDYFYVFEGIQVAGPRLTPQSINSGFHAIPPHSSSDPYSPALYFDSGDYSAVKDAMETWWDPNGQPPGSSTGRPGCYRDPVQGQRFRPGDWPSGDDVFRNSSDPCDGWIGHYKLVT